MITTNFNPIENMNGAIKAGFTREQAEYQANELSKVINNELVTKSFLSDELEKFQLRILLKVGTMMFFQTGLIISVLSFIFKHK